MDWDYAAKVEIWKDNGQPSGVLFGNGMGRTFFFKPYVKAEDRSKVTPVPYQQANPTVLIFDTIRTRE